MLLPALCGADVDVLDSKLSALDSIRSARPHGWRWQQHGCFPMRKTLTARTLSSDVLPAFCNPIMVMSISVALDSASNQCRCRWSGGTFFEGWRRSSARGTDINGRIRQRSGADAVAGQRGRRTRIGGAASHRCVGRCSPWCEGGGGNDSGLPSSAARRGCEAWESLLRGDVSAVGMGNLR
jgi:hypothetical protein